VNGFRIFVPGTPQTKGSAKAFAGLRKDGTPYANVTNDNTKNTGWESLIRDQVRLSVLPELLELASPCEVAVELRFHRPQDHYRSGRFATELKPSAPEVMSTGKDVDKALRSVLDALTGVAYADDRQVAGASVRKRWVDRWNEAEGAEIRVYYLGEVGTLAARTGREVAGA
jgi:Holliday junction resolvase RusA-like endonuclease